jgi:hypothetical protein
MYVLQQTVTSLLESLIRAYNTHLISLPKSFRDGGLFDIVESVSLSLIIYEKKYFCLPYNQNQTENELVPFLFRDLYFTHIFASAYH